MKKGWCMLYYESWRVTHKQPIEKGSEQQRVCELSFCAVQDKISWCPAHWSLSDTRRRQSQHRASEWIKDNSKALSCCHRTLAYGVHRDTKSSESDWACWLTSWLRIQRNVSRNATFLLAARDRCQKNCNTGPVVICSTACLKNFRFHAKSSARLD